MSLAGALVSLLLCLAALLPLQRWGRERLLGVLSRLARDRRRALWFYAGLHLPGVLLHEASHWTAAWLLGVRPRAFSLRPVLRADGSYRLGYVATDSVDPLRAALIGGAPLLAGAAVVLGLSLFALQLPALAQAALSGDPGGLARWGLARLAAPETAAVIYLLVVVSNTMTPSAPDRAAWLPAGVILAALSLAAAAAGLQPPATDSLVAPLEAVLWSMAGAFGLVLAVDLALAVPLAVVHAALRRTRRARRRTS